MSSTDSIYERLLISIQETMDDAEIESADSLKGKNLLQDIGMDSLDVMKFILTVEEHFGIRVPDDDWDDKDLMELDNLVSYLSANAA